MHVDNTVMGQGYGSSENARRLELSAICFTSAYERFLIPRNDERGRSSIFVGEG